MCDQQSPRSACAYAQSDQSLCSSLEYSMTAKLLTEHNLESLSLERGCTDSSESTLVKMPRCWKSHATAHYYITFYGSTGRCDTITEGTETKTAYYQYTVKPVLSNHSNRRPKVGIQDQLSLNACQKYFRMLQESILQYFRPSFSYHLSLRPLFWLFLSGRLRQVLLYTTF